MEIPMFIEELLLFTITGCPKTPFKREMLLISRIPIPKNSIIDFFARYKLLLASKRRIEASKSLYLAKKSIMEFLGIDFFARYKLLLASILHLVPIKYFSLSLQDCFNLSSIMITKLHSIKNCL